MPKRLLPSIVALAAVLGSLAFGVSAATASTPCWKLLLNDYLDNGRVDHTYQLKCYSQAIAHLDQDQVIYGSAANDIRRALQSAIFTYRNGGGKGGGKGAGPNAPVGPNTPLPPPPGSLVKGHHPENFIQRLANAIGPGNATSIPLPLLILAGVGILLVLGALGSYTARRIQARRVRPQPATAPSTPRRK